MKAEIKQNINTDKGIIEIFQQKYSRFHKKTNNGKKTFEIIYGNNSSLNENRLQLEINLYLEVVVVEYQEYLYTKILESLLKENFKETLNTITN